MLIELDLATTIAAWVGALGAIVSLVWAMATWRKSRTHVVVTSSNTWLPRQDGSLGEPMVCVTVANLGQDPVTVTSWSIRVRDGHLNVFIPNPMSKVLPTRLQTNESASYFLESEVLRKYNGENQYPFEKMRPVVYLASGQTIVGNKGVPLR